MAASSELIEYGAGVAIGLFFREWDQSPKAEADARKFYYQVKGLHTFLAIGNRSGLRYDDATGIHAAIASGNHLQHTGRIIEGVIGINPITARW